MIDIVERLRVFIRFEHPKNYETHIVWQAADEIERLRKALAMIVEGDADIVKLEGGVNLLKAGPWGLIARAALGEGKE